MKRKEYTFLQQEVLSQSLLVLIKEYVTLPERIILVISVLQWIPPTETVIIPEKLKKYHRKPYHLAVLKGDVVSMEDFKI